MRSRTSCTPSTAATSRRARRARQPAGWSTCCRRAATSTPSTRRPSRPAARGRSAARSPTRCWPATSPTPASTRAVSGSRCGARARCAPRATTSPRSSRSSAPAPSGMRRRGGSPGSRSSHAPSSAGPASTSPCASRGFFRDAFPHVIALLDDAIGAVAAWTSRTTTSVSTSRPTSRRTVTAAARPRGLSKMQNRNLRGDVEHHVHVVLDQKDCEIRIEFHQELSHFRGFARREAGGRFIKKKNLRVAGEAEHDLELPLFAVRQVAHLGVLAIKEVRLLEQMMGLVVDVLVRRQKAPHHEFRRPQPFDRKQHVVENSEFRKQAGDLERAAPCRARCAGGSANR